MKNFTKVFGEMCPALKPFMDAVEADMQDLDKEAEAMRATYTAKRDKEREEFNQCCDELLGIQRQ